MSEQGYGNHVHYVVVLTQVEGDREVGFFHNINYAEHLLLNLGIGQKLEVQAVYYNCPQCNKRGRQQEEAAGE